MSTSATPPASEADMIDFGELFRRLRRGLLVTVGLAFLGLAIGATIHFLTGPFQTLYTSSRVVFSFPGYERGEYPDKSNFQPDDLRAPEVVVEALKRQQLETTEAFQSKVRAALSVEAIIPSSIVKERDRIRAAGQTLPRYVPDEYVVTLSLARNFPLSPRQRQLFVSDIVSIFQQRFARTYTEMPAAFGSALESLNDADYFDYELVLNQESQNIVAFLTEMNEKARSFRSPRTNLSFNDLLKQSQLFTQLRLNETLGLIRQYGLSKDRRTALVKMDYHLRTLADQERKATEEEKVIQTLLDQTRERMQNYVLGVRSQAAQQRSEGPLIDKGLVDSLLAHDAYNFLVREALKAGLETKRLQSQISILQERRDNMQAFLQSNIKEQAEALSQMEKSLNELRAAYKDLISSIRETQEDYQRQFFGNAVRVSMQPQSDSFYLGFAKAGIAGLCVGFAAGVGLSLLGIGSFVTAKQPE